MHKTPWVGAAFGYGMQGFGLTAVANIVITFAVDGYKPVSITPHLYKCFVLIICFSASGRGSRCCFRPPKFYWHYLGTLHSQLAKSQRRAECKSPAFCVPTYINITNTYNKDLRRNGFYSILLPSYDHSYVLLREANQDMDIKVWTHETIVFGELIHQEERVGGILL